MTLNLQNRLLQNIFLAIFIVFLFVLFFVPIETEDVWWHLSTGRWIFNNLQVPHVDPFPIAGEQTPWLCYHWLGSSIFYFIYKIFGFLGLKLFRALFLMSAIILFYRYARKYIPFYLLLGIMLCLSLALSRRFFLKPDLFNFVFIQLFLIQLLAYREHRNFKKLLILPLLGILWINLHLGAFVYGSALIVIFGFGALFYRELQQAKELGITLLLFWLGFVINPYGIEGMLYPFKTFFTSQSSGFYNVNQVVQDLLPAKYVFSSFEYWYFHLLILTGIGSLFLIKNNRLTLIVLWMGALFAFLCVTRNSIFFVLVSAYVIMQGFKEANMRVYLESKSWGKILSAIVGALVIGTVLFQINTILQKKVLFEGKIHSYQAITLDPLQESLMTFLVKHQINGPMFNAQPIGGELTWFGYPQIRHFIDGRFVLGIERLIAYKEICSDPERYWPLAVQKYGFKSVVMDISNDDGFRLIQYLNAQTSWQLITIKGSWVVYVQKGMFKGEEAFTQQLKAITLTPQDVQELKRLVHEPPSSNPQITDLDSLQTSATMMNLGYTNAGIKQLIESLKLSNQPMAHWAGQEILKRIR